MLLMMMIIASNSRAHEGKKERGEVKGEYGGVWGEKEGNADYGGMVQPSQQHVASCVNVVEWGFGTRGSLISININILSVVRSQDKNG